MKTFFRVFSIILLVCWMGLIFYFSHQTAEKSSSVSGKVVEKVSQVVYPNYEDLTEDEKHEVVASLQGVVRTLAHFCIYGGLGFFAYLAFVSYVTLKYKTRIFWMLETCLLYAASDEYHQTFIEGRSMQVSDIVVDFLGSLIAILICIMFALAIKPLREMVKHKKSSPVRIPITYNINYEDYDFSLERKDKIEQKGPIDVSEELKDFVENMSEEEPEKQKSLLSEEFEYASSIIGKTVIQATKVCNELSLQDNKDKVDLVNLVLGRTEVLKAEILKILNSENSFQDKKDLMQKEQVAAYDYFDSIKAQLS